MYDEALVQMKLRVSSSKPLTGLSHLAQYLPVELMLLSLLFVIVELTRAIVAQGVSQIDR